MLATADVDEKGCGSAEREAAKAKADAEAAAEEQSQMEDAALVCNPLLDSGPVTTGKLK